MIVGMAQIEEKEAKRPFSVTLPQTRKITYTPATSLWQLALLMLTLISFVTLIFNSMQERSSNSLLPPVLYLAEDEMGRLQLFIASEPDWQPTQLTTETAEILNYAPSPQGNQVAYATKMLNGSSQIKLLSLTNGAANLVQTILLCASAECSQPIWHLDGRRLLYERREPPNFSRPQLYWLDTVTGETVLLLEKETAVGSNARFSPDGNWVSFAASPDEGLRLYNFANGRSFTFPSDVGTPAAWHPLGNQLLFQNSRVAILHSENNDDHDEHSHDFTTAVNLFLGSLSTETSELISSDGAFDDGNPAWSPNGEWLAFGRRLARTSTGRQLWLMRTDGSESHALTNDISIHYGPPSWSPDGRFILFQQYNSNTPDQPPSIWLLEITSGKFSQIINNGLLPTWLFP
jgi:TolB protein